MAIKLKTINKNLLLCIGLLVQTATSDAQTIEIWGMGEVPRITDPKHVPRTINEIWKDYDRSYDKNNPLEVKFHKTWQREGDIIVHWVQLTIGTFQGKKSMVSGYWAYPKGVTGLPAILNTNGGPQTGSERSAVSFARLGYACFSPNQNQNVEMQGEAAGLPNTDWGALDAESHYGDGPDGPFQASARTIDAVASPRNNWQFPRQISGRRIISFMRQQPQVNQEKIGIRGHSTGGVLTVYQSVDPRVTAAVPSVGGVGGFMDKHPIITGNTRHLVLTGERLKLFQNTIEPQAYWKSMHAPVLLLGASNDFNAPDWNCLEAMKMANVDRRYVSGANFNHAFPPETIIADYLWFQDKLKSEFKFPGSPKGELLLQQADGVPVFKVMPAETTLRCKRVEMFFTDGRNPLTRFWITGNPKKNDDGSWQIKCPLVYSDEPLFAFANVIYAIEPIDAPYCRYDGWCEMAVTSNYAYAWPNQIREAGVQSQQMHDRMIDDFSAGLRDWSGSLANGQWWSIDTRKISNSQFMGPQGAELVFEINAPAAGMKIGVIAERKFMEANNREHAFYGFFDMPKQGWNTIRIKTAQLKNPFGWPLDDWHKLSRLQLRSANALKNQIEKDYTRIAGNVAARQNGKDGHYVLDLGTVPDKVSGWDEKYYKEAGEEYTKGNVMAKDDVLAKTRFRNLRWEGGEYIPRSKPYVREKYLSPPDLKK